MLFVYSYKVLEYDQPFILFFQFILVEGGEKMKKLICLILTFVFSCCMATSVFATNEDSKINDEIELPYAYAIVLTSTLNISSKNAICCSTVQGKTNSITKIIVTQTLQKKSNSTWSDVTSWSKTVNASGARFNNTKSSIGSGTYRVKTVAKVYSGSNYETVTAYSTTVSC
jgi:hypothetical protein